MNANPAPANDVSVGVADFITNDASRGWGIA